MCTPAAVPLAVALAGTAASAAGSHMNAKAANKRTNQAIRASQNEATAERIRQRGYQDQAGEVMSRAVPAATNPQTLADAMGMRQSSIAQVTQPARNEYAPTPQSTPSVVNTEFDRQAKKGTARAATAAQGQGRLLAFGDADSARGRTMTRFDQQLTNVNDASRNSASLLPLSQQVAARKYAGDPGITFGDVLGLGGQAAQIYGGMGAPGASWGAGAATAAGPYGSTQRLNYNQAMGKGGF